MIGTRSHVSAPIYGGPETEALVCICRDHFSRKVDFGKRKWFGLVSIALPEDSGAHILISHWS